MPEKHYSKQAVKFLKKQERSVQLRIIGAIENLPAGDVKKLQGVQGYRLRIGDYRVIFDYDGHVIEISKIGSRGEIYKD